MGLWEKVEGRRRNIEGWKSERAGISSAESCRTTSIYETTLTVTDSRQKHGSLSVSLKGASAVVIPKEHFASSQLRYNPKLLKSHLLLCYSRRDMLDTSQNRRTKYFEGCFHRHLLKHED